MAYNTPQKRQTRTVQQIPDELRLEAEQVSTIIGSIRRYYRLQDTPPADEIIIYPQTVQRDADDRTFIKATVKLVKEYCGEKIHKVNIRFQVNDHNVVIARTLEYV